MGQILKDYYYGTLSSGIYYDWEDPKNKCEGKKKKVTNYLK